MMKELLRKNRGKLLLSSLVILLPMILAALAGRTVLFWYPIALLAAQWLVVLLVFHDWKNKDQNPKALGLVVWILPAISLCVCYDRIGDKKRAEAYNDLAGNFKPESPYYLQNKRYFQNKNT